MRKAIRPSGGMDSSNPCCWRGKQLYHYGDGVCKVGCAFCTVSQLVTCQSGSSQQCYFLPHIGLHHTVQEIHLFGYGGLVSLGTFAQVLKEIIEDKRLGVPKLDSGGVGKARCILAARVST
jgi:hypothetical protein